MAEHINIKNKRASFEFNLLEKYNCGIQLTGTEIKSIRLGRANISDAYCFFRNGELWVKNMHIAEYAHGTHYNHEPTRLRKLLLTKKELRKLEKKVKEKGVTIVPLSLFISERGFAKLEIAMATGKKVHDKRETIKARESKVALDRVLKNRG